jgi:Tol biopolymer transport system component/DNA-binding winged helix-turn-helix (wHTH) protein
LSQPANTGRIWRFGVFEVDSRREELRRSGTAVKMREQSFRILVYLLEHPGEIVTREELRKVLWPSDTFVDFDHSLNTAVMKLREALGDQTGAPLYIETIPKRGYRFIAPVTEGDETWTRTPKQVPFTSSIATADAVPEPVHQSVPAGPSLFLHRTTFPLILLLIFGTAVGGYTLFLRSNSRQSITGRKLLRTVPITSAAGDAISPVFSPDGREIAYVWDGADRKGYDVYVQLIGADLPLRLTYEHLGLIGPPSWSPDGTQIVFERCDGKHDGIYAVPALGGEEHQLATAACYYTLPNAVPWMANGNDILLVDHCTPDSPFAVVALSLANGQKRCLTSPPGDKDDIGWGFALSPDGSTVAFGKTAVALCCNVYTVSSHGGQITQLTSEGHDGCNTLNDFGCNAKMWTPDGKFIIYENTRNSLPALFRVPATGGTGEPETTYPAIGSFTRDGTHFVYSQHISSDPPAVWRASLASPAGPVRERRKVIDSQFPEMDAQPSPDGTRLVWMSMRTGSEEIFISDSDGHHQTQITHLGRYSGTPRWSPDGKWIAFDSYIPTKTVQIFVVDPEGRNLRSIVSETFNCAVPSWSRDGKFVYFSAKRNGLWQVWKHSLDTGADVQLTKQGGFDPMESMDGKTVYYTRFYEAGIWTVPSAGGPETLVVPDRPQLGFWGHFAVSSSGLYFLDSDAQPHPTINFYDFATRRLSPVFALDEHPARLQPSLSVSEDGKSIYFTQYDRQSVIKMMEFTAQ